MARTIKRKAPDPALVAILAALLDPKGINEDPGPVVRRAAKLIARVPDYINPGWDQMPLGERFTAYSKDLESPMEEAERWGFKSPILPAWDSYKPEQKCRREDLWREDNPGVISFEDAVQNLCGDKYKEVRNLSLLLERNGYPKQYLTRCILTKKGYEHALALDKDREREMDRNRKQSKRKKAREGS